MIAIGRHSPQTRHLALFASLNRDARCELTRPLSSSFTVLVSFFFLVYEWVYLDYGM